MNRITIFPCDHQVKNWIKISEGLFTAELVALQFGIEKKSEQSNKEFVQIVRNELTKRGFKGTLHQAYQELKVIDGVILQEYKTDQEMTKNKYAYIHTLVDNNK
jgi:hypothetical protein